MRVAGTTGAIASLMTLSREVAICACKSAKVRGCVSAVISLVNSATEFH